MYLPGRSYNMPENKTFAVIYLDTQYFDYYALHFQTPLRFTFTTDTVGHMDVLSIDKLTGQLTSFITNYKLPSASILLILSDRMLFCKEFNLIAPDSSENEDIKNFLDMVPFEHVLSKVYKLDRKIIVAATNQDFINVFTRAFKVSSQIDVCIPSFLLGKEFNLDKGLSNEYARLLIEKLGSIKMWSLPLDHDYVAPVLPKSRTVNNAHSDNLKDSTDLQPEDQPKLNKPNNTRIFAMVGIFLLLIGILVFMFIQQSIQNNKADALAKANNQAKLKQQQANANNNSITPNTVLPTGEPATAFTATTEEQNLTVSVQYTTNYASQAAQIVNNLNGFGIKNVSSLPISSSSNKQIVVLTSDKLSAASRQRILSQVQKVESNAILGSNSQLSVDVLILLQ